MPRPVTFEERLDKLLTKYGTITALAAELGTSRQVVMGWRNGKHRPNDESLAKLAAAAKDGSTAEEWKDAPTVPQVAVQIAEAAGQIAAEAAQIAAASEKLTRLLTELEQRREQAEPS